MALRLAQLAERLAVELRGPGDVDITGVATLTRAGPGELSFLSNPRYRRFLPETAAAAVILSEADAPAAPGAVLITDNPYAAFAKAVALFHPPVPPRRGIHPTACVDATAEIDPGAWVDAQCVIGAGARIAAGVQVGPACIVGPGVSIAEHSVLSARVTLSAGCRLGARVLLHPGVVIGSDGFGLAQSDGRWHKVPQVGSVVIGDDVEIGANTTVDRGALDDTNIGTGVKIDNQVQIAHNVTIGAHTAIAACVGISGSTRIGSHCTLAGGVGVVGHLEIADNVHITCMSMVTHSIRRPGRYSSGTPLTDNASWRRNAVRIKQLDQLCRRVDKLEKTKKNK